MAQDRYFLSLLDTGLNQIALNSDELKSCNDKQFTEWLSKQAFEKKKLFDVKRGANHQKSVQQRKTEIEILPLSLENEGSLNGMACVVEQFGTELGRPDNSDVSYLPFDSKSGNFNLAKLRQHFEFETSLTEH